MKLARRLLLVLLISLVLLSMVACIVGGGGGGDVTPGDDDILPEDLTATFGAEVFSAQLTAIAVEQATPAP
jgi:hypothetical protein